MPRCALLACALFAAALPALAQVPRSFPQNALRGEVVFGQPPDVQLNGKPARLAPGARIRDAANMLAMSGTLIGQRQVVHYTLDPSGLLRDVWVLTADELAKQPWPTNETQAMSWRFDWSAQTWSRE